MTLEEFVAYYNGKQVEFDGAYPYQCVDLAMEYMQDVLGLEVETGNGNAHDYYDKYNSNKFLKDNFDRIEYTGENTPSIGDLVVWNTNARWWKWAY